MQSKRWILVSVLLCAVAAGCGPAGTNGTSPTANAGGKKAALTSEPKQEPPAAAVGEFLEAVRVGDDAKAALMFTPAARAQVAQLGYQVAPKKSDTATYAVGDVQYLEGGRAKVTATWTDLGRTDEMHWVLRTGTGGWRIAGMAAVVFEGEPPLLLDFENLEEAMNKIRMLRETIEKREAQLQAQQPAGPQSPVRK